MKTKPDIESLLERTLRIISDHIESLALKAESEDGLGFSEVQQLQMLNAMVMQIDSRNRRSELHEDLQALDNARLRELAMEALRTNPELAGLPDDAERAS